MARLGFIHEKLDIKILILFYPAPPARRGRAGNAVASCASVTAG